MKAEKYSKKKCPCTAVLKGMSIKRQRGEKKKRNGVKRNSKQSVKEDGSGGEGGR